MIILGLNKDNYKGVGYLMYLGFEQDKNGIWNYYGPDYIKIKKDYGLVTNGKLNVKFGFVNNFFNCSDLGLTSLIGAPDKCNGFDCSYNDIEIVDFLPNTNKYRMVNSNICEIKYDFPENITTLQIFDNPKLKSFKHFPEKIGYLFINDCGFTSLIGCPIVELSFSCSNNPIKSLKGIETFNLIRLDVTTCQLETLEYCPNISEYLNISSNPIKNLKGIKGTINQSLVLKNCMSLDSLDGISQSAVPKTINVNYSNIKTLEHIKHDVEYVRAFNCNNLENVYFKYTNNPNIRLSGPNINMYTFFKMGFTRHNIKHDEITRGQHIQISYHDTVSIHDGDVIIKHKWTEDEYYKDLFLYSIKKETLKDLKDINAIKWYGDKAILKDVHTYVKSVSGIVKFNL